MADNFRRTVSFPIFEDVCEYTRRKAAKTAASHTELSPPQLDGFDSMQLIGLGGMASVWRARQVSLDRNVAIKVLRPDSGQTDEDIDRFQSEARSAARMSHPGIVQVYDAFYRNESFCLLMEFVDGYTLGAWIHQRGFLKQEEALRIARAVAEALRYAWDRQQLIHCDIKPDNIMIDRSGMVKVTDFGLSRSIHSLQNRHPGEDGEFVFGTPAYMSPEQALDNAPLTIASDMYALGATLFHACTGRRMFHEKDPDDVLQAQISEQEADPIEKNCELTPQFCDLLERLLAKHPEDRFSRWSEVIDSINRVLADYPPARGALHPAKQPSSVRRAAYREERRAAHPVPAHAWEQRTQVIWDDDLYAAPTPTPASIAIPAEHPPVLPAAPRFSRKAILAAGAGSVLIFFCLLFGILSYIRNHEEQRFLEETAQRLSEINALPKNNPKTLEEAHAQLLLILDGKSGDKFRIREYPQLLQSAQTLQAALIQAQRNLLREALRDLRARAREQSSGIRAAQLYRAYRGPYHMETRAYRESIAGLLEKGDRTILRSAIPESVLASIFP